MINILAISGSLRKLSSNTNLLQAAAILAPQGACINLYDSIGDLPHFNPDLQGNEPEEVIRFRKTVAASDGLLICSPEYAHGVPGVMKNALDWLVGDTEFAYKPVMLFNASPRTPYAQESLIETLTVMTANIITGSFVTISLWGKNLDATGIAADKELATAITNALNEFVSGIEKAKNL